MSDVSEVDFNKMSVEQLVERYKEASYDAYTPNVQTQNINNARRHSGQYTEAQLMQFGLQQALAQSAPQQPKNSGVGGRTEVGGFGANGSRQGRSLASMARGED